MNPVFDWHALAPDICLTVTMLVVLVACFVVPDRDAGQISRIAAVGVLVSLIPIVTLAADGNDRSMFGGAYVVDNYALALKAFFLVVTYVVILVSVDYIESGDYYRGEFYFLLLASTLGLTVMVSARDLITIFVALELISVPTFILAAWRKHDRISNEAGVKYYIIGVLSSALMLYGMSLIFGFTGSTRLSEISEFVSTEGTKPLLTIAIFLTLVGFAFKVERGAVPLLGAGHLRGCADSGHRVPLRRVQGRRFRRPPQHHLLRLLRHAEARARTCGGRSCGSSRPRR